MKKVAVVTGSTRGIGLGIARKLGQAGFRVALNHLSKKPADVATGMAGLEHVIVKADVRKPAGAKLLVAAVMTKWGRVDVLVNNIGDFFETPVSEMEIEKWDVIFDSNVRTALNCTRVVLPLMRKQKSGCIINLGGTSIQSLRGNPAYVSYVMAKTALIVFTKSLALAEGPRGIRTNIVNPGFIKTWNYTEEDVASLCA
jgi:3-hydroxybutyrate dehydrogenase